MSYLDSELGSHGRAPEPQNDFWFIAAMVSLVVLAGLVGFLLGRGPASWMEPRTAARAEAPVERESEAPRRPPPVPVAPRVEPEWRPGAPRPPAEPQSPGVRFGFDDIAAACGDLSLPTYLCLLNRGSEEVAGGARLVLDEDVATFTGRPQHSNAISIEIAGKERYALRFGPPKDKALLPGLYTEASRWPFNDGPYPGIDVTVGSSGCNTEEGRFRIVQIQLAGDKVQRFVADFETTCNGAVGRISLGGTGSLERKIELKRSAPVT